jgi:divalent metal cation (Fe/Co/Zn/Cd) transporter
MFEFIMTASCIMLVAGIAGFLASIEDYCLKDDSSNIKMAGVLIISSLVMLMCTLVGKNYGTRTIQAEAISRGYMIAVVENGEITYQWVEKEAIESEVEK